MADMIPTKVNNYNAYNDADRLIGMAAEVTLPDMAALTETLSGAGILGEIDEPAVGHYSSSEMDIPFITLTPDMFTLFRNGNDVALTLRMSTQAIVQSDISTDFIPSRIVIRGKNKGFSPGKVKAGTGTAGSVKVEILYYLLEINGKSVFELDKLNFVYKVNGVDMLEKVRSQI